MSSRLRFLATMMPCSANTVHVLSAAHNLELMRKTRSTVQVDARLLLVDLWTDPTHSEPSAGPDPRAVE
jgi:hypothetical protein